MFGGVFKHHYRHEDFVALSVNPFVGEQQVVEVAHETLHRAHLRRGQVQVSAVEVAMVGCVYGVPAFEPVVPSCAAVPFRNIDVVIVVRTGMVVYGEPDFSRCDGLECVEQCGVILYGRKGRYACSACYLPAVHGDMERYCVSGGGGVGQ